MAGDQPASPPSKRSVAAVVDRLREQILDRVLMPGEPIRQEEMARRLGISRVPLREALRVLTTEGLLTHRPHQGYFVAQLSVEALRQIHALLEFLETELIRTARWPDDEELAELRTINATMAHAARVGDVAAVNRLNRQLHNRIFALSPQEIYLSEAERFWTLSEPYRLLHVTSTDAAIATEQHEQIIDALAARDRALCLRVLSEHRRETRNGALSMLSRMESGSTPRAVG
ncbi:GntR family transcriptional regulator [Streptomyces luomodiensis]|uniref:GntR family transcriptional regulator n=1 Tax=Streptomyces luomodiensis TaxID=3026192 RepID=A0ABY9VB60_9ACTN|nr:GntR family transcriptional regulator [Streptomyces sp. SCA4-21]WNF01145.1 GntR family transcriptional regulator [Streptomyces sp. SCA4-21]